MTRQTEEDIIRSFLSGDNGAQKKIDRVQIEIEKAKKILDAAQQKADKFLLAVDLLIASTEALLLIQEGDGKLCTCPFCTATRINLEEVKEQMKNYRKP